MPRRQVRRLVEARDYLRYVDAITIDINHMRREVMRLHRRRRARQLDLDVRVSHTTLISISAQETAVRGRLTEIMIQCKRLVGRIEKYRKAVVVRVTVLTPSEVPGSSKSEKREFLEASLNLEAPVLDDLYDVIEAADYVIRDVDQAAYNINRIQVVYELATRPELN